MIDLSKNDIIDAVFDRYKTTYECVRDTGDYMSDEDVDIFLNYVRRDMKKAFKKIDREHRKSFKAQKKAERKARSAERKSARSRKNTVSNTGVDKPVNIITGNSNEKE